MERPLPGTGLCPSCHMYVPEVGEPSAGFKSHSFYFSSCVTSGELLNLSDPLFCHLYNGVVLRAKGVNMYEVLKTRARPQDSINITY